MNIFINKIKKQLLNLPGSKYQNLMMPSYRGNLLKAEKKLDSAVMIILHFKNNELYTSIIKRSIYDGKHSGQMALPGGKYQESDVNLTKTAIRETYEEIGVNIKETEILGNLTSLIIPISNILVSPFVCLIDYNPKYNINKNEVQQIYDVPLSDFFSNKCIKTEYQYNTSVKIPYFNIQNETVWGATAMIFSEFLEVLKRADI